MNLLSGFSLTAAMLALATSSLDGGSVGTRVPVLLELFTSEGCSSCPPADRLLETLDRTQPIPGADLIVISEHVDYWNNLGWKDPYSSAEYSNRQRDYAQRLRTDDVYTPQLVVDGRHGFVGSDAREAQSAVQKAILTPKTPIIISNAARSQEAVTFHIESGELNHAGKSGANVFVVLADSNAETRVMRGENGGHVLKHVAVARTILPVGKIGSDASFSKNVSIPLHGANSANGIRIIAFIQDGSTGQVLGASQIKL